ncbi:MAG: alkaline phosphatase family protein [Terriglobales bacterium]
MGPRSSLWGIWLLLIGLTACGGNEDHSSPSQRVIVITLAAQDPQVIAKSMPYWNELASRYSVVRIQAAAGPEIGNYFLLTAAEDPTAQAPDPNDWTGTVSGDEIARRLSLAHKTWKVYAQSLPWDGYIGGDYYPYLKRHNPFTYFNSVRRNPAQRANIVSLEQFTTDVRAGTIPDFSFVVPDVEHSGSDCPDDASCSPKDRATAADHFLRGALSPFLGDPSALSNTVVVVTFDAAGQPGTSGVTSIIIGAPDTKSLTAITSFTTLTQFMCRTMHITMAWPSALAAKRPSAIDSSELGVESSSGSIQNPNNRASEMRPSPARLNLARGGMAAEAIDVPATPASEVAAGLASLGIVSVKDFGAKGDGTTDDTAAIRAAFASMGPHPRNRLFFPAGVYRISNTLDLDLGYGKVTSKNAPTDGGFTLQMQGSLRPNPGTGAALYIHGGYYPAIQVRIDGGGSCTFDEVKCSDQAIKVDQLIQPSISISCKDYAGTCFYAFSAGTKPGIGAVSQAILPYIHAYRCGQALSLDGFSSAISKGAANGFGHIVEVWDEASAHGSVIRYMGDVTVSHYENDSVADDTTSLRIESSSSVQFGVLSVGGDPKASDVLTIGPYSNVSADRVIVLGSAPYRWSPLNSSTLPVQNGIRVMGGSSFDASVIKASRINGTALLNEGSTVIVNRFLSDTAVHHFEMKSDTNHLCCSAATAIMNVLSRNAKAESYVMDSSLGVFSRFVLAGDNRIGNQAGSASFSVRNDSSRAMLVLNSFNDWSTAKPVTASVGVADPNQLQMDATTSLEYLVAANDGSNLASSNVTAASTVKAMLNLPATTGAQAIMPTCNSANRGIFMYSPGSSGVQDVVQVCAKDDTDNYGWRIHY